MALGIRPLMMAVAATPQALINAAPTPSVHINR